MAHPIGQICVQRLRECFQANVIALYFITCVRTEVLLSGPQGQRRPRVGVAKGGLDQKGSVRPTEVVEYEIP